MASQLSMCVNDFGDVRLALLQAATPAHHARQEAVRGIQFSFSCMVTHKVTKFHVGKHLVSALWVDLGLVPASLPAMMPSRTRTANVMLIPRHCRACSSTPTLPAPMPRLLQCQLWMVEHRTTSINITWSLWQKGGLARVWVEGDRDVQC